VNAAAASANGIAASGIAASGIAAAAAGTAASARVDITGDRPVGSLQTAGLLLFHRQSTNGKFRFDVALLVASRHYSADKLTALCREVFMAIPGFLPIIRELAGPKRTDGELLDLFASERDDAAFTELLRRHGRMVLDVCRCILRNHADAEDAFQATFLILARAAATIRQQNSLASWLHGVAHRTARKALAKAARRREYEALAIPPPPTEPNDRSWGEVQQIVHEELLVLPECLRATLLMCYLEGRTQDQTAAALGLTRVAVKKRLERGRAQLRQRLARRGLGPAVVLAALACPTAVSAVPSALASTTSRAAIAFAAGQSTTIPASVMALTSGGQSMLVAKFTAALGVLPALIIGLALAQGGSQPRPARGIAPIASATGPDKRETPVDQEMKWLAGEWTVRHVETSGEALLTKDQLKDARVVFETDKAELKNLEVSFVTSFSFKLDPTQKPKAIDVTFLEGEMKGKTFEGIYIVRQDEMRICLRLLSPQFGRPKGFATVSGTTLYTFILEPVRKKDPPPVRK